MSLGSHKIISALTQCHHIRHSSSKKSIDMCTSRHALIQLYFIELNGLILLV